MSYGQSAPVSQVDEFTERLKTMERRIADLERAAARARLAVTFRSGAGTPAGVVSAPVGSVWLRTDGGAVTTLYVKESGTGTAGWVAK